MHSNGNSRLPSLPVHSQRYDSRDGAVVAAAANRAQPPYLIQRNVHADEAP